MHYDTPTPYSQRVYESASIESMSPPNMLRNDMPYMLGWKVQLRKMFSRGKKGVISLWIMGLAIWSYFDILYLNLRNG